MEIFILVGFIIVICLLWVLVYLRRRSAGEYTKIANRNNYELQARFPIADIAEVNKFGIFHKNVSLNSFNVLKGEINRVQWKVFDFHYYPEISFSFIAGSRIIERLVYELKRTDITICILSVSSKNYPIFELRPESFADKLVNKYSDIDFPDSPEFSRRYHLASPNEIEVRKCFSKKAIKNISLVDDIVIESNGRLMLFYSAKSLVSGFEIPAFIKSVIKIHDSFG